MLQFHITFVLEPRLTKKQRRHNANELALFDPRTKWTGNELPTHDLNQVGVDCSSKNRINLIDDCAKRWVDTQTVILSLFQDYADIDFEDICNSDVPDLNIHTLCAISALRSGLDFSVDRIATDFIHTVINSITSQSVAPAQQVLGKFTRRKLKNMNTWKVWYAGEKKQLNQFHDLQMFGPSIERPLEENAIKLRSHW